ncbi:hypothetical protein BCA37_24435 [Mycobacterium sp. djl-10]|nr:hypothetical protein BCA37_24435 [Mycobacterium sp. djl-10]
MNPHPDSALDELRALAQLMTQVDEAGAAAAWSDDSALERLAVAATAELAAAPSGDIAAAHASPGWRTRAAEHERLATLTRDAGAPGHADADAVLAVSLARGAVAEAILAVHRARQLTDGVHPARRHVVADLGQRLRALVTRVGAEIRHIGRSRSILLRLAITLGIALSLVAVHHLTGVTRYDDAGRLTLYLFSAVVGSVVCTNALCFEADRVRAQLGGGERLWRILIAKNLSMAAMVTLAALPVIVFLTVADGGNPVALIDQLVTMVFIWLGVANVLSVVFPLRHEPISARLHDGTWKPFLLSFAVSYGVGLTVNLMIYWRLWARYKANEEIAGGAWAAFALVLLSALTTWVLLTVFAVACSREPRLRRVLSREMVGYRKG